MERRRSLQKDYRFHTSPDGSSRPNTSPTPPPPSTSHGKPALSLLHMVFTRVAEGKQDSVQLATSSVLGNCDECSKEPATLSCPLCTAVFCAACAKKVHAAKVLSNHPLLPLKDVKASPTTSNGKPTTADGKSPVSPSRQLPAVPRTTCPVHPDKIVEGKQSNSKQSSHCRSLPLIVAAISRSLLLTPTKLNS